MGYIGMCGAKGYGFVAVLVIFAITPALVNPRAKSHGRAAVTYYLLN